MELALHAGAAPEAGRNALIELAQMVLSRRPFGYRGNLLPAGINAIVAGVGWFDGDQLGIDQGPIVAMIENYRSGFLWRLMRECPAIVSELRRAGFRKGWLRSSNR